MQFDVLVVGGGPGGYVAAIRAAQLGLKTALVEGHKLGGECLNYGCIPSKALITAGSLAYKIQNLAPKMGIEVQGVKVHLDKLVDWKAGIVKSLTGGIGQLLKANGVQVFNGTASFEKISADGKLKTLNVQGSVDSYDQTKKSGESTKVEALNVILATGSYSVEVPSFPFNGKNILGSKQALDVKKIPKKLAVIGGGFIGLEIGTYFSKLGSELEIIEATPGLLPGTDRDCVDVVQRRLVKKGVKLHLNTKALGVKDLGDKGVEIEIENAEGKKKIQADWVLVTVGRKPRTQYLGLDKIDLKTDARGFLSVNSKLQTSVPGVYAIGDIIGGPMLAHKASYEGLVAAEMIKTGKGQMDIRALPWAIFVDPEISTVGHTLESAQAAGWDPIVGKCPFVANGRALTTGDADGFIKIISDKKTDRILGAHMVGPEVSNLIAEVAAYIEMGATTADLVKTVHAHPTLPETLMEAAESVHGMAVHFFERKPRKSPGPELHS
jgi:dihydrolipoamide dehydrogenase